MSKKRLIDTNLAVRYLVQDHEKHAKAAGRLFEACDRGDVVIVVLPAVLAECVFVLESFYARGDIASALGRLISSPGVEIGGVSIYLDALDRYAKTNVAFCGLPDRHNGRGGKDAGSLIRSRLSKVH